MKFIIRNWDHFQHYSDRNPPWIKLHVEILSSEDWVTWSDASRVLAVACMVLASKDGGRVNGSPDYLKRVAYLNSKPNLQPLIDCGFLIPESDSFSSETKNKDKKKEEKECVADASKTLARATGVTAKEIRDISGIVLSHLNEKTGRRFTRTSDIEKCIRRERCSPEDCKLVIDHKWAEWGGSEMEKFVNPSTLFRPKNFSGYLDEANAGPVTGFLVKGSGPDTRSDRNRQVMEKKLKEIGDERQDQSIDGSGGDTQRTNAGRPSRRLPNGIE